LKIGASTPFDFTARNLTAYGGLLPVATMLEKLGFQQLVEETLSIKRLTRVMPVYDYLIPQPAVAQDRTARSEMWRHALAKMNSISKERVFRVSILASTVVAHQALGTNFG
jgi:hypothetical protein